MIDRWGLAARVLSALPAGVPEGFGFRQTAAVALCGSVEWLRRHLLLLARLEGLRASARRARLRVLDFGGAAGGLAKTVVLHGLGPRYRIVLSDIDAQALRLAPQASGIALPVRTAAVGGLPFRDGAFDVAVSSDVLEHLPRADRGHWVGELARVACLGQLHTVPCDSEDGSFAGVGGDELFQAWHVQRFGAPDCFTTEHQQRGLPTVRELEELFPGARLTGFANVDVWVELLKDQFLRTSPWGRLCNGLRFKRHWAAQADLPPFKNCLIDATRHQGPP